MKQFVTRWVIILMILAPFNFINAQTYTIQGIEYSTCSVPETLTASFASSAGALTTNTYRDKVLIQVTGTGQSLGSRLNDAFYVFTGGPIVHDANYYQLVTTIDGTVALNINDNAYQHIVYDVDLDVETTPPYTPAYNANHSYSIIIDMATLNPAPPFGDYDNLRIGVNDGNYGDNAGEYVATITQLCCPDTDGDGIDDCYDVCPNDPLNDYDEDGICGDVDDCPFDTQNDIDGDGICGDVDVCPEDPLNDDDEDGVCYMDDNCPNTYNPDQEDSDCDGIGDACDMCQGGDDSIDNSGPDGVPDGIPDCSQLLDYDDYPDEWKCGNNKILVCHNHNNFHTICINKNALPAHLAHTGDYIGGCDVIECGRLSDKVQTEFNSLEMSISPNPAKALVTIRTSDLLSNGYIYIMDINGKLIYHNEVEMGVNRIELDLNTEIFSKGIYYVRLNVNEIDFIDRILFID